MVSMVTPSFEVPTYTNTFRMITHLFEFQCRISIALSVCYGLKCVEINK